MKNFLLCTVLFFSALEVFGQIKTDIKKDTLYYQMQQFTITSTRYPEQILEIPYAVSLINKEKFEDTKGYGLDEILKTVPGVLAQSRFGNQDIRIVIRGFGARGSGDRSNAGTSRGIRVMIDGIPETEPDGRTSFDHIDLGMFDNIEVVRSNSSALWGNASGGIINLSSIPSFDNTFGQIQSSFGSYGFKKLSGSIGASYENGKLFATFSNTDFKGWRERSSSSRMLVNLGIYSMLSEKTKLGLYLLGTSNQFHIPGPLTQKQFDDDPKQSNTTYKTRDERRFNRLGRIGASLDANLTNMHSISAMVFVNPKYLQRSERGTFRDFTRYHIGGNFMYKNYAEFSPEFKNNLVLGIDEAYQDGAILFYTLSTTNQRGTKLNTNKREGANTFGGFVQEEIQWNDKISLIVGGRYDKVTYYTHTYPSSTSTTSSPIYDLQDKAFEKFTPKAGITYRVTPLISIYANLGGGVEVPAGNETDPSSVNGYDTVYAINPLLEPITSTTFEVGTKQMWLFDEHSIIKSIDFDLALYLINIKNDIIPYQGGKFYFTAGKTKRSGVELGANFLFDYGIALNTAFTVSSNKYDEYIVDSIHYSKPGKYADYKDNKVAGIPDLFYNIGVQFAPKFFYGAYISFSTNGLGKYFVDDANKYSVPAYNIFNASIGLQKPLMITQNLFLKGFLTINNLTDKKYVGSAFINPDLVTENGVKVPVYLEPGLPRTITASISIGWK